MEAVMLPGCAGGPVTITDVVVLLVQPFPSVYEYLMVAVPMETPVTTPKLSTDAINGVRLLHDPFSVASASVVVAWTQTANVPVIGLTLGRGFTVTCIAGEISEHPLDATILLYQVVWVNAAGE